MKNMTAVVLAVLLCSCSGIKLLNAGPVGGVDLQRYKTYDFYSVEAAGDTVHALFDQRIGMLQEAIGTELAQRGYVKSSVNPDLYVNIGVQVDDKIQTRETNFQTDAPRYMNQRRYSWKVEEVPVGRYKEGTVTVDLVDAQQKKMVWTGAIQGIVSNRPEDARRNAQDGMRKLFGALPSKKHPEPDLSKLSDLK